MFRAQILSLPNSKVVAAARSPAKAVHLHDLQKQHEGRLTLVALDLSETSAAQVSRSVDRDVKLDVAAFLGYCMSQHSAVESTRDSQLLVIANQGEPGSCSPQSARILITRYMF